jgi:hypothetical protein
MDVKYRSYHDRHRWVMSKEKNSHQRAKISNEIDKWLAEPSAMGVF